MSRKTDLNRLKNLPRKTDTSLEEMQRVIDPLIYRKGAKKDRPLFPVQYEALYESQNNPAEGLVGVIEVGGGKTWISILLPSVCGAKKAMILTLNQALKDAMREEIEKMRAEFNICTNIEIWSYAELSNKANEDRFESAGFDCIVADEAHNVSNVDAACTIRLIRHLSRRRIEEGASISVAYISGTLLERSIDRWGHLMISGLGPYAPCPMDHFTRTCWAGCTDARGEKNFDGYRLGAVKWLADLSKEPASETLVTRIRTGYRELLQGTPGVVVSLSAGIPNSLEIHKKRPKIPDEIKEHMRRAKDLWIRPDGEMLESPLQAAAVREQLSSGFYYSWDWDATPAGPAWNTARLDYAKLLRSYQGQYGLISLSQVADWLEDPRNGTGDDRDVIQAWDALKHLPPPPVITNWLDPFMVEYARSWIKKNPNSLVYARSRALHEALADVPELEYVAHGKRPRENGGGVLGLSVGSHSVGLNLQKWDTGLILEPATTNIVMEQLFGRMHRTGQESDRVRWDLCVHGYFARAFNLFKMDAEYVHELSGLRPRLLKATVLG